MRVFCLIALYLGLVGKKCVHKWPIHQTPSFHSLNSRPIRYKLQSFTNYVVWHKMSGTMFCICPEKLTDITMWPVHHAWLQKQAKGVIFPWLDGVHMYLGICVKTYQWKKSETFSTIHTVRININIMLSNKIVQFQIIHSKHFLNVPSPPVKGDLFIHEEAELFVLGQHDSDLQTLTWIK